MLILEVTLVHNNEIQMTLTFPPTHHLDIQYFRRAQAAEVIVHPSRHHNLSTSDASTNGVTPGPGHESMGGGPPISVSSCDLHGPSTSLIRGVYTTNNDDVAVIGQDSAVTIQTGFK